MQRGCALILALIVVWTWSSARAEVNVEGSSGLLAVPTAAVVTEGEAVFSAARYYSDTIFEGEDCIGG